MNKKYHFLALTDHRGHTSDNSLYSMLAALSTHPQCAVIDVASRGNHQNDGFFYDCSDTELYVKSVSNTFEFQPGGAQFTTGTTKVNFHDYRVILMRMPRPIDDAFFSFLEQEGEHMVMINRPAGIQKTSTKTYLLNFPKLCPPMLLCYSISEIFDFAQQFPLVLKPPKDYGGKGILRLKGKKIDTGKMEIDAVSYLSKIEEEIQRDGFLAMKFLKNVSLGDKRILVVGGTVMGASLRKPAEDSWLCNVAQGGTAEFAVVEAEEEKMIEQLHSFLKKEGILMFGADTLVDDDGKRVLSEINTLSIGGFPQAEEQTGRPIIQETVKKIMSYVNARIG